jgi:16S rRNA processing protein RimM
MTDENAPTVDVLVGRVGRAHGVRGDVTIDVRTDEPERRFAVGTRFGTRRGPLTVGGSRWHGKRLLVTFEEVLDRSAAEAVRGTELWVAVPADERPSDPEEFYDHQLLGLRVETTTGLLVGEVSEVLHLPAQDVLVVPYQGRDVLVPFVGDLVPVVDVDARRLVVAETPGLLDDETTGAADGTSPREPSTEA